MEASMPYAASRIPAYYGASIREFCSAPPNAVLGQLASAGIDLEETQKNAYLEEIGILRTLLEARQGAIYLEFAVPRLASRIDAVVIIDTALFVLEFKCGADRFHRGDINQTWDYGLDLKNFHAGSHAADIFPLLVATKAVHSDRAWQPTHADGVRPPACSGVDGLADLIDKALASRGVGSVDTRRWAISAYQPTPTIIEAAQALYAQHSVDAIARNDAGAKNLAATSGRVDQIILESQANRTKSIVFVTGVPGAGKTLVGLDVATRRRDIDAPTHAVFLSGNGPLVMVLQEALTRDEVARAKARGEPVRKGAVKQKVKPFIQNVHHFRDEGVRDRETPPHDHVVIFDEAQRAWNQDRTSSFMARRKGIANFDQSEPEFLIDYMDRHSDWAVIVCLVGGGQEINTGEDGIAGWLESLYSRFPHWQIYISLELTDREYAAGGALENLAEQRELLTEESLHLAVSMRSFRAENLSAFVKALLDSEPSAAHEIAGALVERYPIVVTRDLNAAKRWVREKARGNERFGLVASSQAHRMKPHAVDIRVNIDPVHWFLNDARDTRSSYYLEDVATEFHIQGLELDWVCMTWDADLRRVNDDWSYHGFRGSRWTKTHKRERQRYLLNAYRVLLTRARQGMAIFVPPGDVDDPTRAPGYYDETYRYLRAAGIPALHESA
ncbi:MAG: DUF2075 domain-containing protein [Salinisphaera sp.]|uniref:DUF2075 domain-containing protein n=1 Tax=Salinisphaera sp. TaxID=1914330 RepID=UPI003C7E0955